MTATSNPSFNDQTEGLEVTKAFAAQVRGKTVIVTGVNRQGIGFATAQALASQAPARLILAGRTPAKLQECIDLLKEESPEVDYRHLAINLSSQKSVRDAAAEVLSWADVPSIDILINSAGIMMVPERTLSEDGIELHFATNHIGHYLFTCSIMPKLIEAAKTNPRGATRIVNVSSLSPTVSKMRWSDVNFDKTNKDLPEVEQPFYQWMEGWGFKDAQNLSYIPLEAYNQSKVANVLFGIGANKRLFEKHGILTLAVHPGVIQTELSRSTSVETLESLAELREQGFFKLRSLGAGSSTSLVAALDPKLGLPENREGSENHGAYLIDCQISDKAQPLAVSSIEAEKLWQLSEELTKKKFAF